MRGKTLLATLWTLAGLLIVAGVALLSFLPWSLGAATIVAGVLLAAAAGVLVDLDPPPKRDGPAPVRGPDSVVAPPFARSR